MMLKIKYLLILIFIAHFQNMVSQTFEISGKVETNSDLESIHVINKTQNLFTITNKNGGFKISAKLNDTLVFSSLQNKKKTVVIDKNILLFRVLKVILEEQINELDEVTVGKILTGNLLSDIKNTKGDPPINFYDVGIPGYTGKPATQSERRLNEAGEFKPIMLLGLLGGSVPLDPIMNGITGRTKMLKTRVRLEETEALMQSIKSRLARDFFASNPLKEDLKMDFFYFCADDENFIKYCKNETDFKILIFLRQKYKQYLENLNLNKP